jgi:hypothetical protein
LQQTPPGFAKEFPHNRAKSGFSLLYRNMP